MTLPWLPDGYHVKAMQLIDRAPRPFIPPPPAPCGVRWCTALTDAKSGTPIIGPRIVGKNTDSPDGNLWSNRCAVHREHADYRPRERRYNLGRLYSKADRTTRRRKAA